MRDGWFDGQVPPDLPYSSKLLLLAAYLGSYNTKSFNEFLFLSAAKAVIVFAKSPLLMERETLSTPIKFVWSTV